MIVVPLTVAEQQRAGRMAEQRQRPKDAYGIPSAKVSDKTEFRIHHEGARGDLAFAKLVGRAVNQVDGIGGDGGRWDYVVDGFTVSVKAMPRGRGYLIVPRKDWPPQCDLFALLEDMSPGELRLIRWTTAARVLAYIAQHGMMRLAPHLPLSYCVPRALLGQTRTLPFDTLFPEEGDDHVRQPI